MSRSWGKNLSYFACTSGLYTAATPWSQLCTGHPSTPKHKHQMHKILQMQKMQKKPSNNTWKQWTTPVPTASGPAVSLRDFSSPSAQIQKFNMQTESQFYLEGTAYFPCHLCYTTLSGDDCCKNYKGIPSSIITSTLCMLAFPPQAEDATGRCVARCDDHTRSTWHVARSQANPEWPAVNIVTVRFQLWKHRTLEQKQVAVDGRNSKWQPCSLRIVRSMILKWWLGGGFKYFLFFTPTWGRFPFWLIVFKWVGSTTN